MDDLTRKIQDLVDRYGATGVADIPEPERDELVADKLREDATDNPWQAFADIFEDATDTALLRILAHIGQGIRMGQTAEIEREIGRAAITLARQRYFGWLTRQIEEAATTSRARQGRQMAELETDARIHARKEG
jgi:hypothetical protein